MATTSARLGLEVPAGSDQFDTAVIAANWEKLDDYPGHWIGAIGSAPTWGAGHAGMHVSDPATGLIWRWTGSAFVRDTPRGFLSAVGVIPGNSNAINNGAFTVLSSATGIVALGDRSLQITGSWSRVEDSTDEIELALFRGATELRRWRAGPRGGSFVWFDLPSAATYTYTIQGQSVTDAAAAVYGHHIAVIEV